MLLLGNKHNNDTGAHSRGGGGLSLSLSPFISVLYSLHLLLLLTFNFEKKL